MTFANAVQTQTTRTTNGMKQYAGSGDALVDFFGKSAAMRGQNISSLWAAAYATDPILATRLALWLRDVREGAGERENFRAILLDLESRNPEFASRVLKRIPEIGRWDDVFTFKSVELRHEAFNLLGDALRARNGLAAKWTPRKGKIAAEIRKHFGMTPKHYRKSLVELTNVVETQMCAKEFKEINFNHVPSLAMTRYRKAFKKNAAVEFLTWTSNLASGKGGAKINAGAVYPYQVIMPLLSGASDDVTVNMVTAQWNAMPNFVAEGSKALAMVDVSGSMSCPVGADYTKANGVQCIHVALSLGLYLADKNVGAFKDTFLTFSENPVLMHLKGNIADKINAMKDSDWGMSTNLLKAFDRILTVAVEGKVSQADMPDTLVIFSDMQFNRCAKFDRRVMEALSDKYKSAGYTLPKVVFWNLNDHGGTHAKADDAGVSLVSGFSPSLLKSVLGGEFEEVTPFMTMMKVIENPRYDF